MLKLFIIGNLSKDPELNETSTGLKVCRLTVAVNKTHGEDKKADFFNVTVWRGQAENCAKFLKKGSKVAIEGTLQNRSYEDKEGVKKYVLDIVGTEVEFLSASANKEKEEDGELPF